MLRRKNALALLAFCSLSLFSSGANAFACRTAGGVEIPIGGGSANVYVNLTPSVGIGQNLVVDLATQIACRNDYPSTHTDYVSLLQGSAYGGALKNFKGSIIYSDSTYPFPTTSETKILTYKSKTETPWPTKLYLTAIGSAADGVAIKAGTLVAILNMHQTNNYNESNSYVWNVYAQNSVVVPTGGCDVSSRNVTVTLPDYPGSTAIPLTVHCGQDLKLAYYLTGSTEDTANSVFSNTSSSNPAQGIGVQLSNRNGIISSNKNVSLGTVGTSPVSLGLTASYARTTGQVVAGNVQSVIGVTFIYE
ncbi:fimbrial protein [Erwinia tasmaniensis]|uniref:Minor fimbrial subunit, D-mannose specific adhesin (FimH) n=1 Tax=Erwinia tasmaniensis (strain DSM 17950 / CFBP 7177 / CIP 109463 / NCPPB 4357 / Et1/99) TaxID=465817 RepID=B2VEY7_ERWT9|nr:fimbrial protein [Erwinia tasmaniensis]CAO97909.1 Minor fimbrial subunit, D-mannose specific adhesin (FimH) [Erwinia tasmaniensis Et1/99]